MVLHLEPSWWPSLHIATWGADACWLVFLDLTYGRTGGSVDQSPTQFLFRISIVCWFLFPRKLIGPYMEALGRHCRRLVDHGHQPTWPINGPSCEESSIKNGNWGLAERERDCNQCWKDWEDLSLTLCLIRFSSLWKTTLLVAVRFGALDVIKMRAFLVVKII